MLHAFLNSLLNTCEWSGVGCRRLNFGERSNNKQLHGKIRGPQGLLGHFAEEVIPKSNHY